MDNVAGLAEICLNETNIGCKFVIFSMGSLTWREEDGAANAVDPLFLWQAHAVTLVNSCVLVMFEGGTLLSLRPTEGQTTCQRWKETLQAWVSSEPSTRRLLRSLALREKRQLGEVAVVMATPPSTPSKATSAPPPVAVVPRSVRDILEELEAKEVRLALLEDEARHLREELQVQGSALKEAEADRLKKKKQLEAVNDAVRLKAISLLMERNVDLANLRLQIDMYRDQATYLADESDRLKRMGEARMHAAERTREAMLEGMKMLQDEVKVLRRKLLEKEKQQKSLEDLVVSSSSEESKDSVIELNALESKLEDARKSLFFHIAAHFRLARSISPASKGASSSALAAPDLAALYELYRPLSEQRWKELLAQTFGVQLDQSLQPSPPPPPPKE